MFFIFETLLALNYKLFVIINDLIKFNMSYSKFMTHDTDQEKATKERFVILSDLIETRGTTNV